MSDGKDGTDNDGEGDDLFIEITIPKEGPITTYQNTPRRALLE
jgi:hypothetical protein